MKKLILTISAVILLITVKAQDIIPTTPNGELEYTGVMTAPNLSASTLHKNSQLWFATAFKSKSEVITDSETNGILSMKVTTYIPYSDGSSGYNVTYKILIQSKDSKYVIGK